MKSKYPLSLKLINKKLKKKRKKAIFILGKGENVMTILETTLIIILGALTFAFIFIMKSKMNKDNNFNHVDALYYLESTEFIIDNFTAHKIKFDMNNQSNWRKYQNIELKFNKKTNNYSLIISYISDEHKKESLKRIGL